MIYCDNPTRKFWYKYKDNNNILIKKEREKIFKDMMLKDDNVVFDSYFYDWSINSQEGAIYFWDYGIQINKAINKFTKDIESKLFFAGDAYSDFQCFIEGSLKTSDIIVNTLNKK
jgi:hypothetical protein